MIAPPHTLESVLQELRQGLLDGSVVLPPQTQNDNVFSLLFERESSMAIQLEALIAKQTNAFERELDVQQKLAAEQHRISLVAFAFGFVLIISAIAFLLAGKLSSILVSIVGGLIVISLAAYFGWHAAKDRKRIEHSVIEAAGLLLYLRWLSAVEVTDTRDQTRQAVFEAFLRRMRQIP